MAQLEKSVEDTDAAGTDEETDNDQPDAEKYLTPDQVHDSPDDENDSDQPQDEKHAVVLPDDQQHETWVRANRGAARAIGREEASRPALSTLSECVVPEAPRRARDEVVGNYSKPRRQI
jgi:hypothetical protein